MNWKERIKRWLDHEGLDEVTRNSLNLLQEDEKLAEDAFYQDLTFGTGGMRGEIGPGTNRMNVYTVRKASQGIADYIKSNGDEAMARGIVIAYDSRRMSPEFAEEAAKTFASNGIHTYLYNGTRTTPQLSFSVRYLHAFMGVVITASHNPPEYNGYKVYGEDGAQLNLEDADRVIEFVSNVEDELSISNRDYKDELLVTVRDTVDQAYISNVLTVCEQTGASPIQAVFTPLHGAAGATVKRALESAGYMEVSYVKEQMEPDGEFPTVTSPNPEEAEAFEMATQYGKEAGADLLIAVDPDGDRVGIAVSNGDRYELLSGNQTGAILIEYLLSQKKTKEKLPENGRIFKTIVTSEFGRAVADTYGIRTDDVLTGFKFIGEKLRANDSSREFEFLFGYEESYGYLIRDFTRDKDAVQAVLLLVEAAAFYKTQGKNLHDVLVELYNRHGWYREALVSVTKKGADGAREIAALLQGMRQNPPRAIAGIAITSIEDYETQNRIFTDLDESEKIELPQANVLKYFLEDGSWVCLRPSGTEPKVKFYFSVKADTEQESDEKLELIKESFLDEVNNR
ncbi:phosphoglucomutase [Planococcus salinarum]|uniref:Phosphoglucomutase n=1 Tax=Planococcus salinarum TaxID=622695 RepID=A0ABX3D0P3_9BACL|nr:phospho-sugar mutase [Planococcus salinarum]OHX51527.1 phosphoglucomutase [Planococcus salinarum]TAA66881.1 phospho-sugar mutase [Planococcus salinarum]